MLHRFRKAGTALRAKQRFEKKDSDKKPKLEDFLNRRDYTGAVILQEFERNSVSDSKDADVVDILSWLGYAAFHLGDYKKALDTYKDILKRPNADPVNHLYAACCYFFLGLYAEAADEAQRGPEIPLQNRILFHVAHKTGDEQKLLHHHGKLSDIMEDQLSLASIHYLRSHFQEATDIYKRMLIEYKDKDYLAIQVYVALCYYKLDYYDVSLEILGPYLDKFKDSVVATNLKACNTFRLYDGKAAEAELKEILDLLSASSQSQDSDLIKHNLVVFRNGSNALQVLPPLVDTIPEARLNLVVCHLRNDEVDEAYALIENVEPTTPQEYILKGVCNAAKGFLPETSDHQQRELLKLAQQYFQLVGASASECDTIPGRQCMASCFFLLKQWEDVLVYLDSIKPYSFNDGNFLFNYGVALASNNKFKEAEEQLVQVKDSKLTSEYMYISWLARCYIMNGKPADAWEMYLKVDNGQDAEALLIMIANDCYRMGQFYYSAKAFDVLDSAEPNSVYWEGKRGACCGVLQMCVAGKASKDNLRDVITMLRNGTTTNPQVELMVRLMSKWLQENK